MTVSYECKNNQWPGTLRHLEYNQTIRNYFGEKKLDIKDIVFICNIDKIPIITNRIRIFVFIFNECILEPLFEGNKPIT